MDPKLVPRTWAQPEQGATSRLRAPHPEGAAPCVSQHDEQDCSQKGSARDAHQTRSTGLQQEFRLQAPNLAHKCKTSHRHSTISSFRHKGYDFLLNIIQESRWASVVMHGIITTLRIRCVLKSGTPPANRLGTNLKIVRSTVKGDTVFLHSPINKGNNVTPFG